MSKQSWHSPVFLDFALENGTGLWAVRQSSTSKTSTPPGSFFLSRKSAIVYTHARQSALGDKILS